MRQISRLSVIAVSTALLITLSSCSSTQSTLEADDQPSTPIENREMTTDVPESNNASGESPQGSVTDAANFEMAENEDGTVTISRYIGTETDIVIPSQIGGKTVSAIGNVTGTTGAFEGCTSITAVVIPDGVTEIQDNAFYGCTSLETVTIPSSVTLLRNCAFCDCPNLRAVYFKGDAPQQANYVFDSTENVTMYYQDGTSGWENPWHGRPAEVYIPE